MGADERGIDGFAAGAFEDDAPFEHHADAVRKRDDLVKVFGDEKNRRSSVARGDQLGADIGDRAEIEAETGIGGDEKIGLAGKFARQHRPLNIAAGQGLDRREWSLRLDRIGRDQILSALAHALLVEKAEFRARGVAIEGAEGDIVGHAHASDTGVA